MRWFDLRAGGGYLAEYRDIVADERIVITYEMTRDGRRLSVSVVTVLFAPSAIGTQLSYTEQGAYLDELDHPDSRKAGATTQLNRLADLLRGPS